MPVLLWTAILKSNSKTHLPNILTVLNSTGSTGWSRMEITRAETEIGDNDISGLWE